MAVQKREYLFSVDKYSHPKVLTEDHAVATLLTRLLLLIPGSDPLHPEMGVGITQYRYSMDDLPDLTERIKDQIKTYLPDFESANVTLISTPDHMLNIEITIDDVTYVYDSTTAPAAITVDELK